ncbi:MAG: hypothetical protein AB7L90_10325 [Hyphomicrobiaceae bacterium]
MTARHDPSAGTGILSIWNEYPADDSAFYERWYMTEHFPERLGVAGFLRGRRYRAVDADRTYFTFYELASPEVLFSGDYIARLDDPTAWTQRIMRRWSSMFRTVCRRVARVGAAVGGFAAVARFEQPVGISRGQARELMERLANPCVVAVDIWQATSEQNGESTEASSRSEADRWISGAVVVETTNEASARRAKAMLAELLGVDAASASIGIYALIAMQDAPPR